MKTWLIIGLVGMALITSACAPLFLVSKGGDEKKGHFLGSSSEAAYKLLCTSGDLLKVLESTHLSKELKETFYQSNCSADRSFDKVKRLYTSMTSDQRKDIKTAFKKNGFSINGGSC